MFGSKLNYDSHFFINGSEVSGINSIDIGYNNAANISKPLGFHRGVATVGGPTSQTLSISRNLVGGNSYLDAASQAPTGSFTGPFSGSLNYDGAAYGFQSGYVTNVSVNCAIGAIPQANYNIAVYDELRSGANASGTETVAAVFTPTQGDISVTCKGGTSNRVIGFDYSADVNHKPYYTIGSEHPADVKYVGPTRFNAQVQLEVDDTMPRSGYNFLTAGKDGEGTFSLFFTVANRAGATQLLYIVPTPVLVSEQLNATADGSLRLTLNYVGSI
jgi:hypothetical protein